MRWIEGARIIAVLVGAGNRFVGVGGDGYLLGMYGK
jgi:hypothetical protein